MRICFFRHGIAVERGTRGVADDDRPLTPEGRSKTRQAARGVRRLDLGIDLVVSSPLPRALETATILAKVLRLPAPEVARGLSGEASAREVLSTARSLDAECPVVVGHEPCFSEAISLLVCGNTSGGFVLRKAGLAVVDLVRVGPKPRGRLLQLLPASVLRSL
jgi:phosphohistidine phosphatase